MIDRWGRSIMLGWPEYHILYIEAAMTLPTRMERLSAYEDICDLTGRSLKAVMCKAAQMADEARNRSRRAAEARRMAERSRRWQERNVEAELARSVGDLYEKLQPLERELINVRKAKRALTTDVPDR